MLWVEAHEPYDMVRIGSRVRLMDGQEVLIVGVRERSRALLTPSRLTPPLFKVECPDGQVSLMRGNGIAEVLAN
jgi:hypothetical protein